MEITMDMYESKIEELMNEYHKVFSIGTEFTYRSNSTEMHEFNMYCEVDDTKKVKCYGYDINSYGPKFTKEVVSDPDEGGQC